MERKLLPCFVGPGQFPTEYAASGLQSNGSTFSLFAPAETVTPPENSKEGPGLLQVSVVERRDGLALIRLPAQTFENGQHFVTVRESELAAV